ncbi:MULTISPECIES: VCBS repeat-containing protein [unclassified Chryseobacterium]|uniref:FG-GAP repeat domain-containing protein n=1 Tax=unclassified Chryseobacterium TaxID=2593645 RepID=UPI002269F95A|nr:MULTISPECIES: VCBS repeat-containing protein [unclassified Chryseobacterium]
MKILILSIFTFCSSLLSAQSEKSDGLSGDFNGDGKKEFAYVKVSDCNDDCDGVCETTIYFSDKSIPSFKISPANSGTLYTVGDLNNDGKDEIAFYPGWCTSCWHPLYVYTYKKNAWEPLVSPISTHCSQWEEDKFPIKKDPKKKGYVIITSSVWKDDDIKIISKSMKVE